MPTVSADLDKVQKKLHDDGALWTRTELLRLYNDGYRELCAFSGAVRRWRVLDVPGRATFAIAHEWESRYTYGGTSRKFTRAGLGERYQATNLWEVEQTGGVTPTTSLDGITHEWERSVLSGGVDLQYRFTFPANHQRVVRLEWQGRRLHPISVRELDETDSDWPAQAGEPRWWTTGAGRIRSVELYEITTDYTLSYHLIDSDRGLPRGFSGSRTYAVSTTTPLGNAYAYMTAGDSDGLTRADAALVRGLGWRPTKATATTGLYATQTWEVEHVAGASTFTTGVMFGTFAWELEFGAPEVIFGTGTIRGAVSDDRQYWPVSRDAQPTQLCGRVGDWRSSDDSILALEVVTPDLDLLEADTPALIPEPMQKYLRFFVLSRAFGRPGEGRNPVMADHYARRFQRGVAFFQRLSDVTRKDRLWQREEATGVDHRRPPRVRLPAEFPRVHY